MTSTWILPQEAPAWVSKASTDWKSARSCFICTLTLTFLAVLLGVIYPTVMIWQNTQRLELGLDLHKLTLAYENAKYYDKVAMHNARMCALTGDADFGVAYNNAQVAPNPLPLAMFPLALSPSLLLPRPPLSLLRSALLIPDPATVKYWYRDAPVAIGWLRWLLVCRAPSLCATPCTLL